MPKKRLTDLLREEAEKNSDSGINHPVNSTEATDESTDLSPEQPTENIAQITTQVPNDPAGDLPSNLMRENPSAVPSVTLAEMQAAWELERTTVARLETELKQAEKVKADLAKAQQILQDDLQAALNRIKQVEAELKQAQQRYEKLETTHGSLKNELTEQKNQVKKLQTELKSQAEIQLQLRDELETVRETARSLAAENQSLQGQLSALQQENQALKHQGGRLVAPINYSILAKDKFLYNPLSNEDIGWFD